MFGESFTFGPGMGSSEIVPSQRGVDPGPTVEAVPGAAGFVPGENYALSRSIDDLTRQLDFRTYAAMLTDPAVSSAFNTHKMAIVAGGLKLKSAVDQPAWSKRQAPAVREKPGTVADAAKVPAATRALSPDQALAKEILDFCTWGAKRIEAQLAATAFELLDAMAYGSKVAEITFEMVEDGPYAGKLAPKSVKVKPNWAWRYVCDDKLNVVGFLTYDPLGGTVVLPPDKFVWLSWMPKDSDPRGTSLLRAAHAGWNLKVQATPGHYHHTKKYASPGLCLEMAEGDTSPKPAVGTDGRPLNNGEVQEPAVYYVNLLNAYQNGSNLAIPAGAKLNVIAPPGNGEAFFAAFDWYDRQIMLAIEYQTRAALEAKHGSKADGETAQDRKGLVVGFGRSWLASAVRKVFYLAVKLSYGQDAADRLTPDLTYGDTENQDKATMLGAAASAGYAFGPSQMEDLDDLLGMPIRDAEADAQAAQEAAQQAHQAALDLKGPGDTGSGANDKAPPKQDRGKPQ